MTPPARPHSPNRHFEFRPPPGHGRQKKRAGRVRRRVGQLRAARAGRRGGPGHADGPGTGDRGQRFPRRVPVRVQEVPVLLHAQTDGRVPAAAGRLRGRRFRQVPEDLLRGQRHVPQPVPGQAGLVLDDAVDAVVRPDHRQGVPPRGRPGQRPETRRAAGDRHVFLVLLDARVQPDRGLLRQVFGRPSVNAVRVQVRRPRVEVVRHLWARVHTRLQHAGDDQRGEALRRLGQDPGRAEKGGGRAQGRRQERGDHVQRPEGRRAARVQSRLQAGDAVRSSPVRRDHGVRRDLGADAHHHHDVFPFHARETVGRHCGDLDVVRDLQDLVRVADLASTAW